MHRHPQRSVTNSACPAVIGLLCGLACLATQPAQSADLALVETGSTLMQPLMKSWAEGYGKIQSDVRITTAGTGSSDGIAAAITGTAQIGASDAYMTDPDVMRHPGLLNIPLAISAQTINYNLPNQTAPLRLSGPILAGIYSGKIRTWRAPEIAALNPGVTLPDHPIVPIRRADGSGDTFVFTQFLTFSTPDWEAGPAYGLTIDWPVVPGALAATGNDGVIDLLGRTPYGIAYIGGSFADEIAKVELETAVLQNESGEFVTPTKETITAAAASLTPRTPADERLTLAFAPGAKAYPLINYEYAIVQEHQKDPATAAALRDFLLWTVMPFNGTQASYLDPVHFIALPTPIRALTEAQIAKIN
jgi:phosphate transport system substrate-binding protein